MKCLSCSNELNAQMKAAIGCNACPFCGRQIIAPERHLQMIQLDKVLSNTRFTSSESIDLKLKEKVIALLLEHFKFEQISSPDNSDEIVVLDENEQQPKKKESIAKQEESAASLDNQESDTLTKKIEKAKEDIQNVDQEKVREELEQYKALFENVEQMGDLSEAQLAQLVKNKQSAAPTAIIEKAKAKRLSEADGQSERGINRSIRRV